MKVKLLRDVPVEKKHGLVKGRILIIERKDGDGLWVMGDAGEEVKILPREYEHLTESEGGDGS